MPKKKTAKTPEERATEIRIKEFLKNKIGTIKPK